MRASQGLKSISAFFHSCMNETFNNKTFNKARKEFPNSKVFNTYQSFPQFLLFYVDDLAIFTDKLENNTQTLNLHRDCIELMLYALSEVNLRIDSKKINLYKTKVTFLGFEIDTTNNFK